MRHAGLKESRGVWGVSASDDADFRPARYPLAATARIYLEYVKENEEW